MSIASNVIETNSRLSTARTLLRGKLADNGVQYEDSDTIFELLKRWNYTRFADGDYSVFYPSDIEVKEGVEVSAGVDVYDGDENPVEGVPATVIVDGVRYKIYTDSNGKAEKKFTVGSVGTTLEVSVIAGSTVIDMEYSVKSPLDFEDNGEQSTWLYDVVKYPSDVSHSFSTYNYDSGYSRYGYSFSKGVTSSSAVMLIPKGTPAIDASKTGIHFKADIVQKKNSNSGWGDAIALVNSKELSHYRDNKILELGAYAGGKGVKYSNANHVVNSLSVNSGQLNLNSTWYTFHIYYDNGYLIAKIMNGSTEVFSYEGDVSNVISFDSFYPAIMIYDYGGAMLFDKVLLEPWSSD